MDDLRPHRACPGEVRFGNYHAGRLENDQLSVSVLDDGSFSVRDLRNKRDYVQPYRGSTKAARPGIQQAGQTLQLKLSFGGLDTTLKYELHQDRLGVEITGDPTQTMGSNIAYPYPFRFDVPDGFWMVPHASGLAYRVKGDNLKWTGSWAHTMPAFACLPDV